MSLPDPPRTDGFLLNRRIRYAQPAVGFRSGIEPVLLAASIPVRAGERVLEVGTGAGAALLCLAWRVPGLVGLGVDRDLAMATLARDNARANAYDRLCFVAADAVRLPAVGPFDHAFANPPYHPQGGTPSPNAGREAAKRADRGILTIWARAMGAVLRRRGTMTFVLPVSWLQDAIAALMAAGCQPSLVYPLWPRPGAPATLMLLRGVKGGRMTVSLDAGLALHRPDGGFTAEADAVLRDGQPLLSGDRRR